MSELGDRIRELRVRAGLSQRELADRVRVGFPHISKVENGKETPSDELLERLSVELGADGDELSRLAKRVPEELAEVILEKDLAPLFLRRWGSGQISDKDVAALLKKKKEKP